jgi:hypothetical protein
MFIEGARTHDVIQNEQQAREAARAFGAFQGQLASLTGARLHETIPNFHDTPARFATLEQAIQAMPATARRAAGPPRSISASAQKAWVGVLIENQHAAATSRSASRTMTPSSTT